MLLYCELLLRILLLDVRLTVSNGRRDGVGSGSSLDSRTSARPPERDLKLSLPFELLRVGVSSIGRSFLSSTLPSRSENSSAVSTFEFFPLLLLLLLLLNTFCVLSFFSTPPSSRAFFSRASTRLSARSSSLGLTRSCGSSSRSRLPGVLASACRAFIACGVITSSPRPRRRRLRIVDVIILAL